MSSTPDEDTRDIAELYDAFGAGRIGWIRATQVCGVDFCDTCGDCLYCYGSDYCPGGCHIWVVYKDDYPRFLEKHPDAELDPEI